ncbi:Uncharacterized protein TCM_045369 [Theobroma cacao]|uniref:Uncharacterized protein n=1 Tax=Theobroma cacao TaxID=3641 RepID=A0A061FS92_THECC|nr:Uncharacterized protein TCM_045369 [Theobroma cacao]
MTNILRCSVGSLPFTYLGIPLGVSPRAASTWEPVVDQFRQRPLRASSKNWRSFNELSYGVEALILPSVNVVATVVDCCLCLYGVATKVV